MFLLSLTFWSEIGSLLPPVALVFGLAHELRAIYLGRALAWKPILEGPRVYEPDRFLLGNSTTSKAYRVWNLDSGTLEEVHYVEFDEIKGSQEENENLEDVRGIQLSNAMKNIDIGELRPRQVNDDENDQVQVLS